MQSTDYLSLLKNIAYILTTDEKGIILEANELFANQTGIDIATLIGQSIYNLLKQRPDQKVNYITIASFEDKQYQKYEYCFLSKSGFVFWVEFSVQIIPGSKMLWWHGKDISYRKNIEELLADNLIYSNTVKDATPIGLFIANKDGMCREVNKFWLKITGLKKNHALKEGWKTALFSEDVNQVSFAWEEFVKNPNENNLQMDYRYTKPDGGISWVSTTTSRVYDTEGNLTEFIRAELDTSDRHEAERNFAEIANRNQVILATVVDGIITINAKGIVESFNPSAERIFGYTAAEVIGNNINMLMPEPYHSAHDGYLKHYLETGERKVIGIGREVQAKRKDDSVFPLELAVNVFEVNNQKMFVGSIRDITERKENERLKSEFISVVSHELRTPLTAIRGSLGLIIGAMSKDLPEKIKQLLDIAHNNSERLILLINDILDLDKISAGKMRLDFNNESCNTLMEQSVEANIAYAQKFAITIDMQLINPDVLINVDSSRFIQIMSNLLSNAIKFSPAKGVVKVFSTQSNNHIRINVQDNGAGIPEEFRSHIFEKFSQADSSAHRSKGGTGLGLNITKAIVEQMKGKIGFDSEVNSGATFWIEFPIVDQSCQDEMVAPLKTEEMADADNAAYRVLICEDDADVVTILKMQLEQAGCIVDIAYSIQEAREKIEKQHYDLMTLDLIFPSGNGLDFIRELHANDVTRSLPIIVISAVAEEEKQNVSQNDSSGVLDWMSKPIDQKKLLAHLKKSSGEHQQSAFLKPKILHVEDDRDLANLLRTALEGKVDIINAYSIKEAKARLLQNQFALIVLDLGLPDGDGSILLKDAHDKTGRTVPTIILSGREADPLARMLAVSSLVKSQISEKKIIETILSLVKYNTEE